MYGLGMAKGLIVTAKNLILPSRLTSVQYPDRRVGILGLAKHDGVNPLQLLVKRPGAALKAMA